MMGNPRGGWRYKLCGFIRQKRNTVLGLQTSRMHLPRTTLLLLFSLLLLILGVSYGKKCHLPKELTLTHNMNINLNSSDMTLINSAQDNMRLRSLSPWNYRLDKDENRHPPVIAQAICSHDWCLDPEGNKDLYKNSVPITHNMLVLRREVTHCQQSFRLEYQLVTVGCTCSKANVHVVTQNTRRINANKDAMKLS